MGTSCAGCKCNLGFYGETNEDGLCLDCATRRYQQAEADRDAARAAGRVEGLKEAACYCRDRAMRLAFHEDPTGIARQAFIRANFEISERIKLPIDTLATATQAGGNERREG
jgi:hypothetical protein